MKISSLLMSAAICFGLSSFGCAGNEHVLKDLKDLENAVTQCVPHEDDCPDKANDTRSLRAIQMHLRFNSETVAGYLEISQSKCKCKQRGCRELGNYAIPQESSTSFLHCDDLAEAVYAENSLRGEDNQISIAEILKAFSSVFGNPRSLHTDHSEGKFREGWVFGDLAYLGTLPIAFITFFPRESTAEIMLQDEFYAVLKACNYEHGQTIIFGRPGSEYYKKIMNFFEDLTEFSFFEDLTEFNFVRPVRYSRIPENLFEYTKQPKTEFFLTDFCTDLRKIFA